MEDRLVPVMAVTRSATPRQLGSPFVVTFDTGCSGCHGTMEGGDVAIPVTEERFTTAGQYVITTSYLCEHCETEHRAACE